MYEKGDLKKLADELRSKGARVETSGSVYYFYVKGSDKRFTLQQRTKGTFDKVTRVFSFSFSWLDNFKDYIYSWKPVNDWDLMKEGIYNNCL